MKITLHFSSEKSITLKDGYYLCKSSPDLGEKQRWYFRYLGDDRLSKAVLLPEQFIHNCATEEEFDDLCECIRSFGAEETTNQL